MEKKTPTNFDLSREALGKIQLIMQKDQNFSRVYLAIIRSLTESSRLEKALRMSGRRTIDASGLVGFSASYGTELKSYLTDLLHYHENKDNRGYNFIVNEIRGLYRRINHSKRLLEVKHNKPRFSISKRKPKTTVTSRRSRRK